MRVHGTALEVQPRTDSSARLTYQFEPARPVAYRLPPPAPTTLTATAAAGASTLKWQAPPDNRVTG